MQFVSTRWRFLLSLTHDAIYAVRVRPNCRYAKQQADRLESMTRWYRDQFEILNAELSSVRAQGGEQQATRKLETMRRALAAKLERKVRQLQADVSTETETTMMHRTRDAAYFNSRR
jgi:hypothetical protein